MSNLHLSMSPPSAPQLGWHTDTSHSPPTTTAATLSPNHTCCAPSLHYFSTSPITPGFFPPFPTPPSPRLPPTNILPFPNSPASPSQPTSARFPHTQPPHVPRYHQQQRIQSQKTCPIPHPFLPALLPCPPPPSSPPCLISTPPTLLPTPNSPSCWPQVGMNLPKLSVTNTPFVVPLLFPWYLTSPSGTHRMQVPEGLKPYFG